MIKKYISSFIVTFLFCYLLPPVIAIKAYTPVRWTECKKQTLNKPNPDLQFRYCLATADINYSERKTHEEKRMLPKIDGETLLRLKKWPIRQSIYRHKMDTKQFYLEGVRSLIELAVCDMHKPAVLDVLNWQFNKEGLQLPHDEAFYLVKLALSNKWPVPSLQKHHDLLWHKVPSKNRISILHMFEKDTKNSFVHFRRNPCIARISVEKEEKAWKK